MSGDSWRRPYAEAMAFLGCTPKPVTVLGVPAGLPSSLPVGDIAVACVATALAAAAGLERQRNGGRPPRLRIDARHVAAAVRSEAHLRTGADGVGETFAPLSRFWLAADGWVRTHGNYPWHRDALLRALGTTADPDAVGSAIGDRTAEDVEAAVVAAGGAAAAVRTPAQWAMHPHGRATATRPKVDVSVINGATPRRHEATELAAGRLRTLDLTRVIAGPVATRYLAALGADVIRVDPPHRPELPIHRYDGLPGKRSTILDARTRDGLNRLHDLLDGADILIHGYRPGALAAFGLDTDSLAARHPGLVIVSLSAWGRPGPWAERRGFDSLVQAACGIAAAESSDGDRPGALPCQLLDHGTGYLAAAAAMEGVRRQAASGGTHSFELSLAATAAWLLDQPRPTIGTTVDRQLIATESPATEWLITLHTGAGPVTMVTPPGTIGGGNLTWPPRLAEYGQDLPIW